MRSNEDRIADIIQAITDSAGLIALGHQRFISEPLMIRAAKNILSEIGEAAKGIDDVALATMPGVPWRSIKGMRDKVVHDYPELALDVLWETLVNGLPALREAIDQRTT